METTTAIITGSFIAARIVFFLFIKLRIEKVNTSIRKRFPHTKKFMKQQKLFLIAFQLIRGIRGILITLFIQLYF